MSLAITHMSAEAMLCRFFCLKFGKAVGGQSFFDNEKIIRILPSILEVILQDSSRYSCYILSNPEIFYFRKNYKDYWGMGISPPEEFQYFSSTAKDYVGHNYPKSIVFISV